MPEDKDAIIARLTAERDAAEARYTTACRTIEAFAQRLAENHNQPKLTKKDVDGLIDHLFDQGIPHYALDIVQRMIKELGLD